MMIGGFSFNPLARKQGYATGKTDLTKKIAIIWVSILLRGNRAAQQGDGKCRNFRKKSFQFSCEAMGLRCKYSIPQGIKQGFSQKK